MSELIFLRALSQERSWIGAVHVAHGFELKGAVKGLHRALQNIGGEFCPYRLYFPIDNAGCVFFGFNVEHCGMHAAKQDCFALAKCSVANCVGFWGVEASWCDGHNIKRGEVVGDTVADAFINECNIENLSRDCCHHDEVQGHADGAGVNHHAGGALGLDDQPSLPCCLLLDQLLENFFRGDGGGGERSCYSFSLYSLHTN